MIEGSRAFGVAYLYANLLGNEAGRVIYDGGGLIASGGELLARGRRFSFHDVELATAVVDIDGNRREQARRGSHRPRHDAEAAGRRASVRVAGAQARGAARRSSAAWEDRALARARRSSRARSRSACGTTCARAARRATSSRCRAAPTRRRARCSSRSRSSSRSQELGAGGVRQHLPWCRAAASRCSSKGGGATAAVGALLACAYQPTENSGTVTRARRRDRREGDRRRVPRASTSTRSTRRTSRRSRRRSAAS